MNNLKFAEFYKLVALLSIVIIFSSSCKKDDEVTPDYAGTWINVESIPTATGFTAIRDVMIFTENEVTDIIQFPGGSAEQWIDFMNLKGSISVSGNLMTVTIAELGISSLNAISGMPTGTIVSYKEGTTEFDAILSQSGQSKTFKSEYSVAGDKLTLKTDNNEDGDYLDEDEVTIYTKQ